MNDFLNKEYNDNQLLNDTGSNYMKFVKGENKFRIMSSPITGWEWWETTKEGKRTPKRVRINEKIDISTLEDPDSIKRFWAMVVWNYSVSKVQILEITQKGIQKSLTSLSGDEDWGSPVDSYDVVVTRTGDGLETEYEVKPKPATKTIQEIADAIKGTSINLEALYDGEDPFVSTKEDPFEGPSN